MADNTTVMPQEQLYVPKKAAEQVSISSSDDVDYIDWFNAVEHGDINRLKQILERSTIDINAPHPDYTDRTALQIAASNGHTEAVQILIKHGADISLRSSEGHSAFTEAAAGEHAPTVKIFLDLGAKENLQPRRGRRPWENELFEACYAVLQYKESVTPQAISTLELLLDAGDDVNEKLGSQWATKLIRSAVDLRSIELTELLVERGALLPIDILGKTDDYDVIAFLLKVDTKSNSKPSLNIPAGIATAACAGNLQTVELLLRYADQADIQSDKTALVRAAAAGHTDVVECLLDHGYDISTSSEKLFRGATPLIAACRGDNPHGSSRADANIITKLLERGASIGYQDLDGNTALHFAYWSPPTIVQILLAAGADPSIKNHRGNTPLISLCLQFSMFCRVNNLSSRIESLKFIIQRMNTVNAANNKSDTALHVLSGAGGRVRPITSGHLDWAGILIERDADLNIRNQDGKTAGELFGMRGCEQVMRDYMSGDSKSKYACVCLFDGHC